MNTSVPESITQLKHFLRHLDKNIQGRITEIAKQYYKAILEEVDEAIARYRGGNLQIEHRREVWYQTCLGAVRIRRREYRIRGGSRDGERCCLLDNLMGMEKYHHTTVGVQELALEAASRMPYRPGAEFLQKVSALNLSHQTIWRLVAKAADLYLAKEGQ